MSDDEDTHAQNSIALTPSQFSARFASPPAVGAADRAEARSLEEAALAFSPETEEEMMLAGQMALTNRAGINAMMRGYLADDRRGDFAAIDAAVKLMTLSLKQLAALNTQRTLRRIRAAPPRRAPQKTTRKR